MKNDSGSYAVFTEQGSSASQMTAAKVMDVIARQPHCARQAADTVSAYTQVIMEDAPKLLKLLKSECPEKWMRLPRREWPTSWSNIEDPVLPLERNSYDTHLLVSCGKDNLKTFYWQLAGKKYRIGNVLKEGLFLSENVDVIKMSGKKQNMAPMWKN